MVSIIGEKNLIFDRFYRSISLRFFFLMATIDLIDVFCRQSVIGIDPIDVFLTIGAQLCRLHSKAGGIFLPYVGCWNISQRAFFYKSNHL
jgi:hypothetical protein